MMAPVQFFQIVLLVSIGDLAFTDSQNRELSAQTTPSPYDSTTKFVETALTNPKENQEDQDYNDTNIIDDMIKKIGELTKPNVSSEESEEDSITIPIDDEFQNCSLPPSLDSYCSQVPKEVHEYFNNDVSLSGLLKSLFNQTIVAALQNNCTSGCWCLPDSVEKGIINDRVKFYGSSPFCSEQMWTCLNIMLNKRTDCGEELLTYLVDTVLLMCDLEDADPDDLQPECYAQTVKAIYVTYADLTNSAGSQLAKLEETGCNDFKVQMTTRYICANDKCNNDQKGLLQSYESWVDIGESVYDIAEACNISRTCLSPNRATDYSNTTSSDFEEEQKEEFDDSKELEKFLEDLAEEAKVEEAAGEADDAQEGAENKQSDIVNKGANGSNDETDTAMLLGLVIMTTVIMIGILGLSFFGYRRYCRARCGYDKWGYTKLNLGIGEEMAHLH